MTEWIGVAGLFAVCLWVVFVAAASEYQIDKEKERGEWPGYERNRPQKSRSSQEQDVVERKDRRHSHRYGVGIVLLFLFVTVAIPLFLVATGLAWIAVLPTAILLAPIALAGLLAWLFVRNSWMG